MITIKQLAHFAFKNKNLQNVAVNAGCYHCTKIFKATDVKEYTDAGQTALCPLCSIDSVVFDNAGFELTEDSLKKAYQYWFQK
jgi:hypothetical protein